MRSQLIASFLARTFALKSHEGSNRLSPTEKVEDPALIDTILIYDRHLECLVKSTEYIAVSHVWHRDVTDLEHRRIRSTACVAEAANFILESLAAVSVQFVT
jgi:hypothetical protein